jgi:hypothetical protein
MKLTLNFHIDRGHGWLELPKVIARGLGKDFCNSISFYSFQDKDNLFLEEDDDASKAMIALKNNGFEITFNEIYHKNDAPCRNFKRVNC